jgi:DNA-binding transcriptional ArsR family regulator
MRNKKIAQNSFSALADNTRLKLFLKIVELSSYASLGDNPIVAENTAKHLKEVFHLAKSTISHHLDILIENELIFVINKNRFSYLFPNFIKFKEFTDFINTQVLPYHLEGEYLLMAEIYIKTSITKINEFMDYLIIHDYKSLQITTDISGKQKIYFKISGFIEPFYIIIHDNKLLIFSLKKNLQSSKLYIEKLIAIINKIY